MITEIFVLNDFFMMFLSVANSCFIGVPTLVCERADVEDMNAEFY